MQQLSSGVRRRVTAARAMGLSDHLGSIEMGKWADRVVVRGDPLDDIRHTRDVRRRRL